MLCLRVSGPVCGVPDVSNVGCQVRPMRQLTAYLTAYRLQKQPPNIDKSALV